MRLAHAWTAGVLLAGAATAQVAQSANFQLEGFELASVAGGVCDVGVAAFTSATGVGGTGLASSSFGAEVGFLAVHDPASDVLPAVFHVDPAYGPMEGGTSITVCGVHYDLAGLAGPLTVEVGGVPATDVVVLSDTTLTATVPSGASGPHDVQVTSVLGSTNRVGGFLHTPALTATPYGTLGHPVEIENYGPVGGFFDLYYSSVQTNIPLPPFGTLLIGPFPFIAGLTTVPYPAPDGVQSFEYDVPTNPNLIGKSLYLQSVAVVSLAPVDIRLTNAASVTFRQ